MENKKEIIDNKDYEQPSAIIERTNLTNHKRKEELDTIKSLKEEVIQGDEGVGILSKLSEVASRSKILRGAVFAGVLLTAEPALGQMVANNKNVDNAMMNFAQGLRRTSETGDMKRDAQMKFVEGINNPTKLQTIKVEAQETGADKKEEFVEPKKGTSEYFFWKLIPGTREEKEKAIEEFRIKQKEKQEKREKIGGNLNNKELKRSFDKKDVRFNLRPNKPVRRIVSPEITLRTIETQEQYRNLRQNLLGNNYNLSKSNVRISQDAYIGNINASPNAKVEIGPNTQIGDIEAEDGADVQIGTIRY